MLLVGRHVAVICSQLVRLTGNVLAIESLELQVSSRRQIDQSAACIDKYRCGALFSKLVRTVAPAAVR